MTRAKRLEAENYKKQLLLQKSETLKQQQGNAVKSRLVDEFSLVATPPPLQRASPTDRLELVREVARIADPRPVIPSISVFDNVEFVPPFAAKSRLPRPPRKTQTPVKMKLAHAASTSIDSEVPPDSIPQVCWRGQLNGGGTCCCSDY